MSFNYKVVQGQGWCFFTFLSVNTYKAFPLLSTQLPLPPNLFLKNCWMAAVYFHTVSCLFFLSSMAVEFPLVLYDCKFENINWIYDREVQEFNVTHLQQLWANHAVKTHMLYSMLQGLDSVAVPCGTGMTGEFLRYDYLPEPKLYGVMGVVHLCKVWR